MSLPLALPDMSLFPPLYEIALAMLVGALAALPLQLIAHRYEASPPLPLLIIGGAAVAAIGYAFGGTMSASAGIATLLVSMLLFIASLIDFAVLRLPNPLVLALAALGIGMSALDSGGPALPDAIAGGVLGLVLMGLTGALYKLLRRQSGLGMGDVKIAGALGLLVGAQGMLLVLLAASLLQALIGIMTLLFGSGKIRQEQPFGPALALATWLMMLFAA
ncbi:MAG: A24 family peptidase [Alphaproteobacteria bacterium]